MSKKTRSERMMPNGVPKWIRCYDNRGETIDRYTVVYTGNYPDRGRLCRYVGMSSAPFHPQGFCQHGEHTSIIDWPRYGHLGKRISFTDLPPDCQKVVIDDYKSLWEIE